MVRLEVQEHGDLAGELVYVFELEARELADDPGARLDLAVEVGQRAADVPCDRCLQHDAEQLAGGRLAVRPGHPEEPGLQQAVAELDLAPDRDPAALGLGDQRDLAWNSGALDEHVGPVEHRQVAVVPELAVGANDVYPAPLQRRRGRLPRAREPEHEHLPWQLSHSPVTVAATDPLLRARPRSRSLCRGVAVSRGWLPPGLVLAEAGEVAVVQR